MSGAVTPLPPYAFIAIHRQNFACSW